jgi:2-polyprenyl-3-methyl-5-hydroxy-6-metoxy-1,4-benzoquinol methylase
MMHQASGGKTAGNGIAAKPCSDCYLCGSPGIVLYEGLTDRLFDIPGKWGFRKCSSAGCGLVWLDPMPIEADVGKLYENYHTHAPSAPPSTLPHRLYHAIRDGYLMGRLGYSQGVGPRWYRLLAPLAYLHPYGRLHVEASAMYLPSSQPGSKVLDVGCGGGYLLARMKSLGWQGEGTEIDPVALEVARARGIPVRLGELADQNYAQDHFDAIHISHVVEHVHDPMSLVHECHRILKPGGTLVVLTPNVASWTHLHFKTDWRGLEPPRHLHLFSPRTIMQAVAAAGFSLKNSRVLTRATSAPAISLALREQRILGANPKPKNELKPRLQSLLWLGWERTQLLRRPGIGDELVVIVHKS